jgi:hypothetical protein
VITLETIVRQSQQIMHDRGIRAGILWVGAAAGMEVYQLAATARYDSWSTFTAEPALFGMNLDTDQWLPPDVWRLADEHGTLLYDCRQGKPVP